MLYSVCAVSTLLLTYVDLFCSENNIQVSSVFVRNHSKTNDELDEELNKPLKYTTSPANDWKASHSRLGSKPDFRPWYEPHIINISLIVFMIYFFVLREENDIDLMLSKPLTDTLNEK